MLKLDDARDLGEPEKIAVAHRKATAAGVHLASTPQGEAELQTLAEANMKRRNPVAAGWYDSMIRQGAVLREANADVRRAYDRSRDVQQSVRESAEGAEREAIAKAQGGFRFAQPDFKPVAFYVYRHDHTGRGVQHNDTAIGSADEVRTALEAYREENHAKPFSPTLNPRPGWWVVAEDASGRRLPAL